MVEITYMAKLPFLALLVNLDEMQFVKMSRALHCPVRYVFDAQETRRGLFPTAENFCLRCYFGSS